MSELSTNSDTTIVKSRKSRVETRAEAPIFSYFIRRRDGERPLAICAILVSLLTLYLAVDAALHAQDWRPVAFYAGFCICTLAAAVLLGMQWRNDELLGTSEGLVHYDWRRRRTDYNWSEVTRGVEQDRPDNRRCTLNIGDRRVFVLHADYPGYQDAVEACRQKLAQLGRTLEQS